MTEQAIKLLVVDDEPMARRKIRSFALARYGFAIAGEAENGEQAWKMVLELMPDIIVADIGMPLLNGLELLRRINELPAPPKVIMLTCYEDFDKIQLALRHGAFDYMTKLLLKEEEFMACLAKGAEQIKKERLLARKMISQLLLDLAEGAADPGGLMDQLAEHSFSCRQYRLALLRFPQERSVEMNKLAHLYEAAGGSYSSFLLRMEAGLWAILFSSAEQNGYAEFHSWSSHILRQGKDACAQLDIEAQTAAGEAKYSLELLPQALEECRALLEKAPTQADRHKDSQPQEPPLVPDDGLAQGVRSEVREAIRFLAANYAEEIDLPLAAQHVNLSPSWFGTLFRNETGRSFFDYLQEYRLEQAQRLLRQTDYKIYEIASLVGIPNSRYFSRLFAEKFAMNPLDYRKHAENSVRYRQQPPAI